MRECWIQLRMADPLHSGLEAHLRSRRTCLWAELTHTYRVYSIPRVYMGKEDALGYTWYTILLGHTWVNRIHRVRRLY